MSEPLSVCRYLTTLLWISSTSSVSPSPLYFLAFSPGLLPTQCAQDDDLDSDVERDIEKALKIAGRQAKSQVASGTMTLLVDYVHSLLHLLPIDSAPIDASPRNPHTHTPTEHSAHGVVVQSYPR
jgi:hypothetical protein